MDTLYLTLTIAETQRPGVGDIRFPLLVRKQSSGSVTAQHMTPLRVSKAHPKGEPTDEVNGGICLDDDG